MTNPNSLIARIYKAKYFSSSDILDAALLMREEASIIAWRLFGRV